MLAKSREARPQDARAVINLLDSLTLATSTGFMAARSTPPSQAPAASAGETSGNYSFGPRARTPEPPASPKPEHRSRPVSVPSPRSGRRSTGERPDASQTADSGGQRPDPAAHLASDPARSPAPGASVESGPTRRRDQTRVAVLGAMVIGVLVLVSQLDRLLGLDEDGLDTPRPAAPARDQPRAPAPSAPTAPKPPADAPPPTTGLPTPDPRAARAVNGYLRPPAIPRDVRGSAPAHRPLPARGEAAALPPKALEARRVELETEVATAKGEARAAPLWALAQVEWASSLATHQLATARYEYQASQFVAGEIAKAPKKPKPRHDRAIPTLERFVSAHPEHAEAPHALRYLSTALLAAGRQDEAVEHLERLIGQHPEHEGVTDAHEIVADHNFAGGLPLNARRHYEALAAKAPEPKRTYARFMLGYVHFNLKEPAKAVDSFQRTLEALRTRPEQAKHLRLPAIEAMTLAYARLDGGAQQARGYFRGLGGSALERRQSEVLAYALSELGRHGDAAALLARLADEDPAPRLRLATAEAKTAAGAAADALAIYSRKLADCVELQVDGERLRCLLGRADATAATNASAGSTAYQRVIDEFQQRGLANGGAEASWPARAAFAMAAPALARFETAKKDPISKQQDAVRALDAQYAAVTALADPEWTVAASHQRGRAHALLAARLARQIARKPKTKAALQTAQTLATEESVRAFRSARIQARKHGIENEWSRKVEAALRATAP